MRFSMAYWYSPVRVWRRLLAVPKSRVGELPMNPSLGLGLVIDAVEPDDSLQENVQFGMRARVLRHFEQRLEYVLINERKK